MKLALSIMYLAATSALAYFAPVPQTAAHPDGAQRPIQTRLLNQINEHRRQFGLAALTIDPVAQRAAQFQAEDMQSNDVMRHQDSGGRSPMTRYLAFGGRAESYGENVAYYGDDIRELGEQWAVVSELDGMMMAEKPPQDGHRENILSSDYSAIGVGVAVGPHGIFIAEDFVGRGELASK